MSLTRRERLRRAIEHRPIDRLPTQVKFTADMGEKLARHFGVSVDELGARLGNHMVRVDVSFPRPVSEDALISYDWWGVGWSTQTEGYWPVDSPLGGSQTLTRFAWPDPEEAHLLDGAKAVIAQRGDEYFVIPNLGFCLFERAWALRGFEAFLLDLGGNLIFAEELLERITEIQVVLARRFVQLGVDGGYFGDDYGSQEHLLFSPRMWRTLFKPRLARMFRVFREAGLPVILHSDGNIGEIVPDLVEIGVTVLNPVQPEVLDHGWLQRTFGDELAFYGGISTQTVLPFGSPDEVRSAVHVCAEALAPNGTGLIVSPSHRLQEDVPVENVDALLGTCADLAVARP